MFDKDFQNQIKQLKGRIKQLEKDACHLRGKVDAMPENLKFVYKTEYVCDAGFRMCKESKIGITDLLRMFMDNMGVKIECVPATPELHVLKNIEPEKPSKKKDGDKK